MSQASVGPRNQNQIRQVSSSSTRNESPPPPLPARPIMTCNLCGNIGSVVACEDCSSMTFCSSCDDMYHRHPKRKFHLRKSVAHPPPSPTAANWNQMSGSSKPPQIPGPRVPMPGFPAMDAGHPSKMPIPPPRRKKSLRSLSSLDGENFGSNGSVNSLNHSSTGTLPSRLPSLSGPPSNSQTQVMFPPNYSRNTSSNTINTQINPRNGQQQFNPGQQPPQPITYSSSITDLAANQLPYIDPAMVNGASRRAASGSRSGSLARGKNHSLQDLRNAYDPMNMYQHQPPPPTFMHPASYGYNPYVNPYGPYPPMNPWDYQSVDMEEDGDTSEDEDEIEVDEEEVSSEMASSSHTGMSKGQALKNRSMRHRRPETMGRSYSAYQLPVWPAGPPPPPSNPYYGYGPNYGGFGPNPYYPPPHPSFYGTSSFASSSPPGSLQSLTNLVSGERVRRKRSMDRLSTTSSRNNYDDSRKHRSHRSSEKPRRETSVDRSNNFPRTLQDHRSSRRHGSKPRSVSGRSSRYESESDDYDDAEEEIYSDVEEEDDTRSRRSDTRGETRKSGDARRRKIGDRIRGSLEKLMSKGAKLVTKEEANKPWSCKHCTYVNQAKNEICDICFKSNPQKLNQKNSSSSSKSQRRFSDDSNASQRLSKTESTSKKIADELQVSDDLVREQLEIERELKRRRENEERIAEENKRIEERERKLREKMNEPPNLDGSTENTSDEVTSELTASAIKKESDSEGCEEEREDEDDEEMSESLVKLDQDKKRYQRRPSPKKSVSRHRSVTSPGKRSKSGFVEEDTPKRRDKSRPDSSRGQISSKKILEVESEEDEVDKEMKAIESLISSLAQQKLDIEKIERFISTATVNVSNSGKKEQPEQIVQPQIVASASSQPQQLPVAAPFPMPNQFQTMVTSSSMPGNQSMIPIQNFQPPTFYDQLLGHRPSYDAAMSSFNNCWNMEPPLPPRMASLRTGINGSMDSLRGYGRYGRDVGSNDDVSSNGVVMIKVLREAERKGYSADDVEVALNFSSSDPIEWLDNNWMSMIETVLRFANNQIIKTSRQQSGSKGQNIGKLNLVLERDAKIALRKSKGDIWQAVEKCIQKKEEEGKDKIGSGSKSKNFTLEHNEAGPGNENQEMNFDGLDFDDIECGEIIDPNVNLFHPDDSDAEGDEELINLFIEKWKYEKEQEMNERKERRMNGDEYDGDRKLFDDEEEYLPEKLTEERAVLSPEERLKQKTEKAREKFFSSLEEIDSIVTNGPETGKDLRKYLFNKYFGNDGISDEETSKTENSASCSKIPVAAQKPVTKVPLSDLKPSTSTEKRGNREQKGIVTEEKELTTNKSCLNANDSDSDEYEYVEVIEYEDEEDLKIPDTNESRRAFFGGKDLDEYVSQQDGIAISPEGLISTAEGAILDVAETSEKRKIDTSNLGHTFEFLMSLNVDQLDADETIEELMRISDEGDSKNVKQMRLPPTEIGVMSRSESPRFTAEPDIEESVVNIIPKRNPKLDQLSRTSSPVPSISTSTNKFNGSLTNLIIDIPDQKYFECELCAQERVPVSDMITMLACEHQACKDCIRQYLTLQIRERTNIIIQCPFCKEPDIANNDEEAIWNFVSLFDVMIRSLLPYDVHELYQRKIRDRTLMKDPSFRWCPSCSSGFIAGNLCATTVMCPDCQTVMCIKCNRIWEPQHAEISCEAFLEWKKANDPSFSLAQLDYHLKLFGIDCPNCKFHYELSKGGCMHFHCVQCEYEFCGGCKSQFVPGSSCNGSKYCEKLGLHAHHPRNCLFYLRDKDPDVLMKLLDDCGVIYSKTASKVSKGKPCPVMEQKRSSLGYKDESCNRLVEFSGFCRNHYIEYLGQLIMKHNIDPIHILEEHELEMVLKRNNFPLPEKVDYNYFQSLVEAVKVNCPLNKNHASQ